jgi:hypothetical protein
MEKPLLSLHHCLLCKEGHVYRSQQEAIDHLAHMHFRDQYDLGLHELAHLKRAHRYWIRTEDEVRKELFNRQQLHLLQICLRYVKTLYARADKIHQGIPHRDRKDSTQYLLPNDLVDCFEATALFLMQSAAALIAIEDAMRQWHHVPGNSLDEIRTPTVKTALERLGELGQGAQAAITRAEKTLALSDPGTNMLSMGHAGAELLVLVLLHNVQKQRVLLDVDMNVNQLYQESTSKLVSVVYKRIGTSAHPTIAVSNKPVPTQAASTGHSFFTRGTDNCSLR